MKQAFIFSLIFLIAASEMSSIQRDIAERILEDEEIWSADTGRLNDTDQLFFMKRVEEAARNIGNGAEKVSESERESYIKNYLYGENGVREALKKEIQKRARGGELPSKELVPKVEKPFWSIPNISHQGYVIVVISTLILAQIIYLFAGKIKRK